MDQDLEVEIFVVFVNDNLEFSKSHNFFFSLLKYVLKSCTEFGNQGKSLIVGTLAIPNFWIVTEDNLLTRFICSWTLTILDRFAVKEEKPDINDDEGLDDDDISISQQNDNNYNYYMCAKMVQKWLKLSHLNFGTFHQFLSY